MTGNFPSGFEGFQAQLEAAAESLGGDDLAWMAAEHTFSSAINSVMGNRNDRSFEFKRPHRGYFLRATAQDFDRAATLAMEELTLETPVELLNGQRWTLKWGTSGIARCTREHGIVLAYRRGTMVALTEPGYAVMMLNGCPPRSHFRHFRTEDAAAAIFERWAQKELKM